jgi:hypothetical protein
MGFSVVCMYIPLTKNGFHIKKTAQYKEVLEMGRQVFDAFF